MSMLFWKHLYEIRNYKQSCINISTLNSQILFSKYKYLKSTLLRHAAFKKAQERTWLTCTAPWNGCKKGKFQVRRRNYLSYGFYCCVTVIQCAFTMLNCDVTLLHCVVTVLHFVVTVRNCGFTLLHCAVTCSTVLSPCRTLVSQFSTVVSHCSTVLLQISAVV